VVATANGTPHRHRNVTRRGLQRAAQAAGLDDGWPSLRFHDLRHTFTSHLILDVRLDVAQVGRILGHARVTITLDVYTHLLDHAWRPRCLNSGLRRLRHPATDRALPLPPGGQSLDRSSRRAE
jgi:integrase